MHKKMTIIIISHRKKIIKEVDYIIQMQDETIFESGYNPKE